MANPLITQANGRRTPTYQTWSHMKSRCTDRNYDRYPFYGGRGIQVCERWNSFENFLADVGERPAGKSLDRIDVNGNYEPGNVRWATQTEQCRNRRSSKLTMDAARAIRAVYGAGAMTLREVGVLFGITAATTHRIVHHGIWKEAV